MLEVSVLHKIFVVLINVLGIGLGLIVYFKDRRKSLNQTFFLISLLMLMWIDFAFLGRLLAPQSPVLALSCLKLAWFATPLFFGSLYLLVTILAGAPKKYSLLNRGIITGGIVIAFTTLFSRLVIQGFQLENGGLNILYGKGIILFLGYGIALIGLTIVLLLRLYPQLKEKEKAKVQYFFVGLFIFYTANLIFNIILPIFFHLTLLYYVGDYSTVVLLIFIAYAIVKRRLFEIKVVLTQLLVGAIAILLLVNIASSGSVFEYIWKGFLFVAFSVAGALLIKSVLNEIKRREQLEKVTAQLRIANVKLRKLDQAKTEFLAVASHQLRTPLTAIRGYLSMLRRGDYGQVPTDFVDPLREVYQSTLRLAKLTSRLLDASRIETGRLKMNLGPVSLGGLISSVVDELKPQAKEKGLYLKFLKSKEKLTPLPLDLEKIRQVLLNIIDNGLKYTQKGGVEVKLELVDSQKVRIKVQDTGEGMTKEELKKIFQSFSRGLAGEKFHTAGAGLGLYIAKEFVALHQGKIWATSPGAGKGTTVWVELPLKSNQAKTEKGVRSFSGEKRKKTPW